MSQPGTFAMADASEMALRTQLSESADKSDDLELWLFRVPKEFDVKQLTTKKLKVKDSSKIGTVLRVMAPEADENNATDGQKQVYELLVADGAEGQTSRALVRPRQGSGALHCGKAFSRFFEVRAGGKAEEEEGASPETATKIVPAIPVGPENMIIPYAPVAQRQGLSVGFRPIGSGTPMPPESKKRKKEADKPTAERHDEDKGDKHSRKDKKEKKRKHKE